jgi:hypothetical protein
VIETSRWAVGQAPIATEASAGGSWVRGVIVCEMRMAVSEPEADPG